MGELRKVMIPAVVNAEGRVEAILVAGDRIIVIDDGADAAPAIAVWRALTEISESFPAEFPGFVPSEPVADPAAITQIYVARPR